MKRVWGGAEEGSVEEANSTPGRCASAAAGEEGEMEVVDVGVEGTATGVTACWACACTMDRMREGSEPRVMTVAHPAAVASSAAMSLVSMPPVPSEDPSVDVLTVARISAKRER